MLWYVREMCQYYYEEVVKASRKLVEANTQV